MKGWDEALARLEAHYGTAETAQAAPVVDEALQDRILHLDVPYTPPLRYRETDGFGNPVPTREEAEARVLANALVRARRQAERTNRHCAWISEHEVLCWFLLAWVGPFALVFVLLALGGLA